MSDLTSLTLPVRELSAQERARMYVVFARYYESISQEQFQEDLAEKDAVILLLDRRKKQIQGFSTLKSVVVQVPGQRSIRTLYSGDTVVDKAYWGQKVLGSAFLRYLWIEKLKRPTQPLYWFLISKGYKTYLLMANNFKVHYPRFEKPTPAATQTILNSAASTLFGTHYASDTGVIRFPTSLGQLKGGIADITATELASSPRIRFFAEKNPDWKEGVELACLAEMTFLLPLEYALKRLRKVILPEIAGRAALPASKVTTPAPASRTRMDIASAGAAVLKLLITLKSGGGR